MKSYPLGRGPCEKRPIKPLDEKDIPNSEVEEDCNEIR